ncbi:pyridoxal phosphate-dependent aminotransferase [Clostridium butyricum]|uniref:pyridoxal phosphate-dependent aminotransferase n=1 Tax=Clostridium butyricum TaxID=1492 RepID=UPI0012B8CEA6|nr:histidinol-phosphate transaminase [Clostridium butyricum]
MGVYNRYIDSAEEFKIKLDANEIFMNVDDNVIMKIKSSLTGIDLYRYPSNEMGDIKKLYGKYAKVNWENIIVGNGSDEVLELIIGKVIGTQGKVLSFGPDFVMYDFFVKRFKGELIKYDIGTEMKFDVDRFIELGKSNNVDMIIFSNPNNPTGINIAPKDIVKILEEFKNSTVVIDEAYYEFNGETMIPYINNYSNLFITRTLSKAWGLAALRVGFLISSKENIEELLNYKVPYTISSYSQKIAEIVLKYPEKIINNTKIIIRERELLYERLTEIEKNAAMKIEFFKSKGNFIFGRTKHKEALIKGLETHRIYIRSFNDDSFRITVGSPRENRKVIEAIKEIFVY